MKVIKVDERYMYSTVVISCTVPNCLNIIQFCFRFDYKPRCTSVSSYSGAATITMINFRHVVRQVD